MHDTITDNRKNDMINGKTDKLIYDKPNRIYIRYHRVNALYNRIYTTIEQDYRKKKEKYTRMIGMIQVKHVGYMYSRIVKQIAGTVHIKFIISEEIFQIVLPTVFR